MILNDGKEDLTRYLENKKFKKIFILSGKNSIINLEQINFKSRLKIKKQNFLKKTIFPVSMN